MQDEDVPPTDPPPSAPDAEARAHALLAYGILDTPPEAVFDDPTLLAAQVCQTPTAFITFIDGPRQFFKASVGAGGVREANLKTGFCPFTVAQGELLVIPDTHSDPRFRDNPASLADPPVRFYAGVPIRDPAGVALGTLCVVDLRPRELMPDQIEGLRALGRQVEIQLGLRLAARQAENAARQARAAMRESEARLRGVTDSLPVLIAYVDSEERYRYNNHAHQEWIGVPQERVIGRTLREVLGEDLYARIAQDVVAALAGKVVTFERRLAWPDGTVRSMRGTYVPQCEPSGLVEGFAILVTDETESERTSEERRVAAERLAAMVAAQQEVGQSAHDLDAALGVVVRRAQEIAGADGAVVEMVEGEEIVYRAASGQAAAHVGLRLRLDASLSGLCVAEGRLLASEDTEMDPRVDTELCRRIGLRSTVVVPLAFLGRTVGVLKVYSGRPNAFHADVFPLLELMVSMIVAAMSGAAEAKARRALELSEERQKFALEGAGIGTWSWDIVSNTLAWSETCKALFGLPRKTHMTRALFLECIHPEDREGTQWSVEQSLSKGTVYEIEYRIVWPDGTIHWLAAKGQGYKDAMGRPVLFEGMVQNIDARKASEAVVSEASERQKSLMREVLSSVTGGRLRLVETEAELPASMPTASEPIPLTATEGLSGLRHEVKNVALGLAFAAERWQDMMTATSESGMNAIVHGGGHGVSLVSTDGVGTIQVRVQDWGAGINMENLPKATLARGWSSTTSLGHGLAMMLQSVDRLWLLTGPSGTTVVIEQDRAEPLPIWL